jgi:hypothetical protein
LYLFVIAVVFRPSDNELKLHAVEQDTTIAALTGITLPERAARIKTLPSLVRAVSALATTIRVSIQVLTVFQILTRHLLIFIPRGSCRVFDFSAVGLQGYGPTNEGISKQLWIPWQF